MSNDAKILVGGVQEIRRYPVKSMGGEELTQCPVADRGLLGDRTYAILDKSTGNVVSAKNPRKWGGVLDIRAEYLVDPASSAPSAVQLTFPDGTKTQTNLADVDAWLSKQFGRDVQLSSTPLDAPNIESTDAEAPPESTDVHDVSLPPGSFFDLAPLHLASTATLTRLAELLPDSNLDIRRFRPNLVIETLSDARGFVENDWVGRSLSIGDEVVLRILCPCPRCIMTTLAQGRIPKDPSVLRAAATHNMGSIGVYAFVERSGLIRVGDAVQLSIE